MSTLICPECGAENPLDSERCHNCNALLNESSLEEQIEAQGELEEPIDLLSQTDHDLPDLLHALKQEDGLPDLEGEQEGLSSEDFVETYTLSGSDELQTDGEFDEPENPPEETADEIPEWLRRVRQRASEEPDSVGEITQKIQAAEESLVEEKSIDQHGHFSSWLGKLREEPEATAPEAPPIEIPMIDASGKIEPDREPDWLERIRLAEGKFDGGQAGDDIENRDGDSLLQWLVSLEDGTQKRPLTPLDEVEETPQIEEGITEESEFGESAFGQSETQEIRVLEHGSFGQLSLDISKEEQSQADQLSATIVDETAVRPVHRQHRMKAPWLLRLILGLILIVVLSLGLFIGAPIESNLSLKPQNQALLTWAETLQSDASVLILFDYQAGYADEINLVAQPILNLVLKPGRDIAVMSSSPAGVLLVEQVLNAMLEGKEIAVRDLGFVPSGILMAYGITSPSMGGTLPLGLEESDYDGVLILSDAFEGTVTWIEQFSARSPDTPLNCLVTAQAGPLLAPYWDSGQISGLISGISEAHRAEAVLDETQIAAYQWRAYRFGIVMAIVMLVIGATIADEGKNKDEGQGGA